MLYGRVQRNQPSDFVDEIDDSLIKTENEGGQVFGTGQGGLYGGYASQASQTTTYRSKPRRTPGKKVAPKVANTGTGADKHAWQTGDKVAHKKWGTGTVVSVNGTGTDMELDIAFPQQGVKRLLASFAPITKVEE